MKKKEFIAKSEAETLRIAAQFAALLQGGEVLLLDGSLGAGKSTFVRGLAQAFGIAEPIRSPTFTLMHVHSVKGQESSVKSLVHIDAYRLKNADDLRSIGAEDFLGKREVVTVIEWGSRVSSILKKETVFRIAMSYGSTAEERLIRIVLKKKNSQG